MVPKNAQMFCDSVGWAHLYIYTCVNTQYDCINSSEKQAYKDNRNSVKFVPGGVKILALICRALFISVCV